MGPLFGVIAGGTGTATKREVAFEFITRTRMSAPATAHQDGATFNFKHRMAHTKVNAKQRDKKALQLQQLLSVLLHS